jgi:hypothetical protein
MRPSPAGVPGELLKNPQRDICKISLDGGARDRKIRASFTVGKAPGAEKILFSVLTVLRDDDKIVRLCSLASICSLTSKIR